MLLGGDRAHLELFNAFDRDTATFYINGHNLAKNSPIFNPKPPLESPGPALDIWTTSWQFHKRTVRLLAIIRYIVDHPYRYDPISARIWDGNLLFSTVLRLYLYILSGLSNIYH